MFYVLRKQRVSGGGQGDLVAAINEYIAVYNQIGRLRDDGQGS